MFYWLLAKVIEHNFVERCHMCSYFMKELFKKITVELPNQTITKENRKSLLHAIVGDWYVEKLGQKIPPLNKS